MKGFVPGIFTAAQNPLALTSCDMTYKYLALNAKAVHRLGDYLFQLYYCGQRRVFEEGLPVLLNELCVQLGLIKPVGIRSTPRSSRDPLDPAVDFYF